MSLDPYRVGLSLRALFRLTLDEAVFVFLGTHDQVRRFLRDLGSLELAHSQTGTRARGLAEFVGTGRDLRPRPLSTFR